MAGKFDDAKGRAKEAAGDITGDKDLKNEGKADRAAGSIKGMAESAKEKVGEVTDKLRNKAN